MGYRGLVTCAALLTVLHGCGGGGVGLSGRDIFVSAGAAGGDGSVARPFGTVEEGLLAATSGDRVRLAAGDYVPSSGKLSLKPGVSLEGAGAATTRIVGDVTDAAGGVAHVAVRRIRFGVFEFARGNYTASPTGTIEVADCHAIAIRFSQGAAPSESAAGYRTLVSGCTVTKEVRFVHGAGAAINTVRNCTVTGEIVLAMGAGATNTISGNTVNGAIHDRSGVCTTTISGNTVRGTITDSSGSHVDGREDEIIEGNTVEVVGAEVGIDSRGKSVTIRNNVVTSSTPATGISCVSGAPTNVIGNRVTVPYAPAEGGLDGGGAAFFTLSGAGTVRDNVFAGGYVGIYDKSAATFTNNTVTGAHVGAMTWGIGEWRGNTISGSVSHGLVISAAFGPFSANSIRNNGGAGVLIVRASRGTPDSVVDLGGGVRGGTGGNVITGNGAYDLVIEAPLSEAALVPAQGNKWDHSTQADIAALDIRDGNDTPGVGKADFTPFR